MNFQINRQKLVVVILDVFVEYICVFPTEEVGRAANRTAYLAPSPARRSLDAEIEQLELEIERRKTAP